MIGVNPFLPTAGAEPPQLIGRAGILDEFRYGLRIRSGAPGLLTIFTGARGIGKTVMLGEAEDAALRGADQGRDLGALSDERQHRLTPPKMRDAAAPRLLRQEALVDAPERHQVIALELLVERVRVAGRGARRGGLSVHQPLLRRGQTLKRGRNTRRMR